MSTCLNNQKWEREKGCFACMHADAHTCTNRKMEKSFSADAGDCCESKRWFFLLSTVSRRKSGLWEELAEASGFNFNFNSLCSEGKDLTDWLIECKRRRRQEKRETGLSQDCSQSISAACSQQILLRGREREKEAVKKMNHKITESPIILLFPFRELKQHSGTQGHSTLHTDLLAGIREES